MLEPRLAPYIYVFDTPSSDLPAMKAMASLARCRSDMGWR